MFDKHVIDASKSADFLCYAKPNLIEGRTVYDVTYIAGSYGMGGYGFLGLKLESNDLRSEEWLVCTLFGAENWINVNGNWLGANQQEDVQRPLHGHNWVADQSGIRTAKGSYDEFTPMVVGQMLTQFECKKHYCRLAVGDAVLQITPDATTHPLFRGNGRLRKLTLRDDLRFAWILAKDSHLFF